MNSVTLRLVLIEKHEDQPHDLILGEAIEIHLEPSRPIIIGRAPDVDVLVRAPSVGRKVLSVCLDGEGVRIDDLGSGGGSSLEIGGIVTARPRCHLGHSAQLDGAVLRIGRIVFRVELAAEP
jgi:pSer/pThr/pTyr-binding forkhead associated (FHA) protein